MMLGNMWWMMLGNMWERPQAVSDRRGRVTVRWGPGYRVASRWVGPRGRAPWHRGIGDRWRPIMPPKRRRQRVRTSTTRRPIDANGDVTGVSGD